MRTETISVVEVVKSKRLRLTPLWRSASTRVVSDVLQVEVAGREKGQPIAQNMDRPEKHTVRALGSSLMTKEADPAQHRFTDPL